MLRSAIGSAVAATLLGLCGCGSSTRPGSSQADVLARANAICDSAQRQVQAIPAPANLSNPTVAAAYFDKVAPISDAETTALGKLNPPAKLAAAWSAFMTEQQGANALLQEIRGRADAKDRSTTQELQLIAPLAQKVQAAARQAGADVCAR
jgi:hypothetical protein